MKRHEQLLLANKSWASERVEADPEFFSRLADIQQPDFLWIGCSDSRVPPSEITQTRPGEIFIHRNIANLVVSTDMNLLSVLQYAVQVLNVKHIIVCGHYNCGGVKAALTNKPHGLIDHWLSNIKEVYGRHRDKVDACSSAEEKTNKLVECNVIEQLWNLAKTPIVQRHWQEGKGLALHGWVYDLKDGVIKTLLELNSDSTFENPVSRYQF